MAGIKGLMKLPTKDLMKMSRAELARETSKLVSAANKRLKRFEEKGIKSTPAAADTSYRFSVKGQDINQLRGIFIATRNFLENKTSSLSGYKKVKQEFNKLFGVEYSDVFSDKDQVEKLFNVMNRLREKRPTTFSENYRDLSQAVAERLNLDIDDITDDLLNMLEDLYIESIGVDINDEEFVSL